MDEEVVIDTKAIQFLMEEKEQFDFLKAIADSPEKTGFIETIIQPMVMRGISVQNALGVTKDIAAYVADKTWKELNTDTFIALIRIALEWIYDPEEAERAVIDILTYFHEKQK